FPSLPFDKPITNLALAVPRPRRGFFPAASFASPPKNPSKRIDDPGEEIAEIPFSHAVADLVEHEPGGTVADLKFPGEG
ncbi:MAG: hypothetical protein K6U80_20005, partial [Firmicutes bacterium]|nr:hypothetical protein [Bacillota bacterium]